MRSCESLARRVVRFSFARSAAEPDGTSWRRYSIDTLESTYLRLSSKSQCSVMLAHRSCFWPGFPWSWWSSCSCRHGAPWWPPQSPGGCSCRPIGIALPGLPDYTKTGAVVLSILLATIIFEPARLFNFRPRWFDLPMLVFCLCPYFTSTTNDLGAYDGIAAVVMQCVNWLLPYWIGRLYLTDVESFRELGLGMIIGGLCLIPFCLFEIQNESNYCSRCSTASADGRGCGTAAIRPRVFF